MQDKFGWVRWEALILALVVTGGAAWAEINPDPASESQFITNVRQLTFEGRRSGEGYFSSDGRLLVFQSEREEGNPFFQIYLMDLENGDTERISPGSGKTTCAWLNPDATEILFASTHGDPQAQAKQQQELDDRAAGKERRYSWDYDENFELYRYNRQQGSTSQITDAVGYDAEGSWSPDGQRIAFASNRSAYTEELTPAEQAIFANDKAYFNEIYIMQGDGSGLKRLTHAEGYDGGPFFSPDGQRICWRRFSKDGALAEIMTMNVDGSDQRQLTRLGAMSWAPFYHPSGEYLIFTTNRHGFGNFELYLVDAEAKSQPVRVTFTDGFDGLPVFSPDGRRLAWTTNRTANKKSQIFIADWNHKAALQRLAASPTARETAKSQASEAVAADEAAARAAVESAAGSTAEFSGTDLLRHVDYLCRPELEGRLTGTAGEQLATAYVAAYMDRLGLQPAGDDGTWYQPFEFTSGISLGAKNELAWGTREYEVDTDWRPLTFSDMGDFDSAPMVFAGYGIAAPADEEQEQYDSFVHLDVKDKWVLCFRFLPEDITPERRQHLARYSSLRYKAMKVRDLGARGLLVVSGPSSKVKSQLVALRFDGSLSGSSIPVISVTDAVAGEWLQSVDRDLGEVQRQLDDGKPAMGISLPKVELRAKIDLLTEKKTGRNVLGRLPANELSVGQTIVVGAHVDHLGRGTGGSLARDDEATKIHFGADDNASGVAAMLEIAHYLADQQSQGKLDARRDVLFAAWSGEELGLLGASHFVDHFAVPTGHGSPPAAAHASSPSSEHSSGHGPQADSSHPHASHVDSEGQTIANSLYPQIAACLNLDMVGRFEKRLVLQGVGSSSLWPSEIERRNAPVGLPITVQNDCYLPTDASAFFLRGVPILSAFTGSHSEYHTPRDTPDKLNYEDAARIARFMGLVARSLARAESAPDYIPQAQAEKERPRAGLRAYLGTIPDYAQADIQGVKLSGVAKNGPAAKAGVQGGDVIVGLAGVKVENIYDYTYAIDSVKIGQPITIEVQRGEQRLKLTLTPGSRE